MKEVYIFFAMVLVLILYSFVSQKYKIKKHLVFNDNAINYSYKYVIEPITL